jgi:tetratricopeptide (TPR) repeat protein
LNAVIAAEPKRVRAYALLSEALRTRGDRDGAMAALQAGIAELGRDVVLLNERGVVSAEHGDLVSAAAAWHEVLARDPRDLAAFANLSGIAMKQKDAGTSQVLVDHALSLAAIGIAGGARAHPDVLRRAIHLALVSEAEGLARSARVAKLARALVDVAPDDAWGAFALAKALAQLGDTAEARTELLRVEHLAPATAVAAEAQRARFALDESDANRAIEASLRAALHSPEAELDEVAARARRQAREHGGWMPWLAAAVAERRQGRWAAARAASNAAIVAAPGCAAAHAELVTVNLGMNDSRAALRHAERALALEGETPRTLGLLARSLEAAGRGEEARSAVARALVLDESDDANLKLAAELRTTPSTWFDKVRGFFGHRDS